MSIDYVPFTTSELAESPWDVAVAIVQGIGPASFNTVNGSRPPLGSKHDVETMVYTPVDVHLDRTIKGRLAVGANRVLVAGGHVGCYGMRVYPTPAIEIGSRYMFILASAFDSSGANELPFKEARFAWLVDDEGMVSTVDGPMSIDELAATIDELGPSPKSTLMDASDSPGMK